MKIAIITSGMASGKRTAIFKVAGYLPAYNKGGRPNGRGIKPSKR